MTIRASGPKPDLSKSRILTDDEARALMAEDPDAAPALEGGPKRKWFRPALVRKLRHRLNLSQADFARRYGIPVGSIRAWEIHRHKPDAGMTSYLLAISGDPEGVAKAYAAEAAKQPQAAE